MNPKLKKVLLHLAILLVPFVILTVIYPYLPDKISTGHHLFYDSKVSKQFVFVLGILPYIVFLRRKR